MKKIIQIFIKFLFYIFFYVPFSEYAFCFAGEDDNILLFNYKLSNFENSTISSIFSVLDHGAKGNGVTNDMEAFKITWDAACRKGGVMLVPSRFTFLLQPVNFDGSYCQPNVVVQVDGKIVAPIKSNWKTSNFQWILFSGVSKGLTITGNGVIDGSGVSWWNSVDTKAFFRPHAVRITNSSNVTVTGITIANSPRMHIYFDNSQHIHIYNFSVSSPGHSPNTDGVHISFSQHVQIHNTTLSCGDDCVSIQTGSSDVKIYNVSCGPGHGYSIGGLGPRKEEAHVSDVTVLNSLVHNSMNGVRIKTWPGGYGSVHNIVFTNITMSNVGYPIVIDQYYCGGHPCNVTNKNVVAVSNITYTTIKGTYLYKPIYLVCSNFLPCTNLTLANIQITPAPAKGSTVARPNCTNAYVKLLTNTTPPLNDCLSPKKPVMAHAVPTPARTDLHVPASDRRKNNGQ